LRSTARYITRLSVGEEVVDMACPDIVQEQLDAYNAHDLERFAACYAPDILVEDGQGNEISRGAEQFRLRYGWLFEHHPDVHAELVHRIHVADFVVDEERVTGRGPDPTHVVAVYRVVDDRIVHVRFLR
jgi:hypothetical protein